jgi:hypothetical protein
MADGILIPRLEVYSPNNGVGKRIHNFDRNLFFLKI